MKLNRWLVFSLVSLALVGCAGGSETKQAAEKTAPVTTSAPAPTQVETTAQAANAAKSATVKSGSFVSGEHPTQGSVRLVDENGKTFLELDQAFKTSNMGPDLVVILHRSSDVLGSTQPPAYALKEGDYTLLAPLQKFSGAQRYAIPATVNLSSYQSVAIWCRKFNATFGAAKLMR
ncbi:DM13 domain-containing protein [Phormidium sp. FACHB-592]|uniref:DM13 domain-containing protein n=1 Tax=Stenomitos frigidus AS-A4 TaxID=2933935 RepID=A0ABV0KSJ4_9CYAN|nr:MULTISPECIES: DM13 domain-containing protein [Cyanophyceae]MBD2037699.1 DM13 domain-containing protein [Leptolyngbya sp. FACHB-321]MBD2075569.1 DM13 domain-containing protein [Phormidium sp. FACHB-592]